jgi:hypothetical protein
MLDNDYAALARIQNALVDAQQMYDEQKRKLDRLAKVGTPTHDATDTLGLLELYLAILQRHRDHVFAAAARKHDQKR